MTAASLSTRWDVYRRPDGTPVTIPWEKCQSGTLDPFDDVERAAIAHAYAVWHEVIAEFGGSGGYDRKSRLLGRMLYEGKPPHDRPPPRIAAGGWWDVVEDGHAYWNDDRPGSAFATRIVQYPDGRRHLSSFGIEGWVVPDAYPVGPVAPLVVVAPIDGITHAHAPGLWRLRRALRAEAAFRGLDVPTQVGDEIVCLERYEDA